jgi:hypothetical protein
MILVDGDGSSGVALIEPDESCSSPSPRRLNYSRGVPEELCAQQ